MSSSEDIFDGKSSYNASPPESSCIDALNISLWSFLEVISNSPIELFVCTSLTLFAMKFKSLPADSVLYTGGSIEAFLPRDCSDKPLCLELALISSLPLSRLLAKAGLGNSLEDDSLDFETTDDMSEILSSTFEWMFSPRMF